MNKERFENYEDFLSYYILEYNSDLCSLILQNIIAKRVIFWTIVLLWLLILYYFLLISVNYTIFDLYLYLFFSISLWLLIFRNITKYTFYYFESVYFLKQFPVSELFIASLEIIWILKPWKDRKFIEKTFWYIKKYNRGKIDLIDKSKLHFPVL